MIWLIDLPEYFVLSHWNFVRMKMNERKLTYVPYWRVKCLAIEPFVSNSPHLVIPHYDNKLKKDISQNATYTSVKIVLDAEAKKNGIFWKPQKKCRIRDGSLWLDIAMAELAEQLLRRHIFLNFFFDRDSFRGNRYTHIPPMYKTTPACCTPMARQFTTTLQQRQGFSITPSLKFDYYVVNGTCWYDKDIIGIHYVMLNRQY